MKLIEQIVTAWAEHKAERLATIADKPETRSDKP